MVREPLISHEQEQEQPPTPVDEESSFPPSYSCLIKYLYAGHFLARWGARMWEFSVGLYMINVWPDSLLFAAIYGVMESASTALFGSVIGQWVNRLTYVKVLQLWLVSQNLSYIIAGGTVVVLLTNSALKLTNFTAFLSLVMLTNIAGAVGVLSTLAGTILIEREWVVVISEGHSPDVLTKMNSVVRRIDLFCKLFGPVITGFIISFVSLKASAMALALWNTLSVWVEYWLFLSVYNGIPALGQRRSRRILLYAPANLEESTSTCQDNERLIYHDVEINSASAERSWKSKISSWISEFSFVRAWGVYIKQDVLLAGVSLALLFFTVLSFNTLMTATLEWEGIPAYVIGIARGVSAVVGIAATFLYPILQANISTIRTGLWSIWSQWCCLLLCVVSVWLKNHFVSAYMLMAGVATSRLGLWMFDLSVIQQMQDHVPESDRCVVGGVQNSLQSTLELMAYIMGIIISNPQEFWKLTLISFVAVTVAAVIYCSYHYRVRKHLFHFEKLQFLIR